MRLRSAFATAVAVTLAAVGLSACGAGNAAAIRSDGSVDLSKVTLTVGDQKGGSEALLKASGDLDQLPYKVDWKPFTSGPPLLDAISSGAVDIGAVGNTPPLFAIDEHKAVQVVSAYSQGAGGDAIVTPKGSSIHSVADLKGKKVAVAKGSSANYNLLAQLKHAGLTFADITPVWLQPSEALAAFKGGSVDAWAIWDPFTSQAELDAGAQVLSTGDGLVNGLAFNVAGDKALKDEATRAAIRDFVARLAKAQVWAGKHKDVWAASWSKETGLEPAVTRRATDQRAYTPVPIDAKVVSSEQEMWDAFKAQKQVSASPDLASYFSKEFNADIEKAAAAAENGAS